MKYVILAVAVLAVTGCANNKMWYKDGATQSNFDRDFAECKYEAFSNTPVASSYYASQVRQANLITLCMEARGYHQEEVRSPRPPPPFNLEPVNTERTPYGECIADPKWFNIAKEKGAEESQRLLKEECEPLAK